MAGVTTAGSGRSRSWSIQLGSGWARQAADPKLKARKDRVERFDFMIGAIRVSIVRGSVAIRVANARLADFPVSPRNLTDVSFLIRWSDKPQYVQNLA